MNHMDGFKAYNDYFSKAFALYYSDLLHDLTQASGMEEKRSREELLSMIDLALDTKDQEWFAELVGKLTV